MFLMEKMVSFRHELGHMLRRELTCEKTGTMKVSGGPKSAFAMKIRDQIKFWVTERSEIPLLLAALTMEFYEESRAAAEGV